MRALSLLICAALFLMGCGPVPSAEKKRSQLINVSGEGPTTFPNAQLPLRIYCDTEALEKATADAVKAWNDWMGIKFLTVSNNSLKADIYIFGDFSGHYFYNGLTKFVSVPFEERDSYRYDYIPVIEMYIKSTETLAHEIGHAVGLAHDPDNRRSIMHPYSNPRYLPTLEPRDRKALRRAYLD